MKLLIVTPKADKNDENVGAFYYWFEKLAEKNERIVILSRGVGSAPLPAHGEVYSFDAPWFAARVWKYWKLFAYHYARSDAVFFHMMPEFVLAAAPFLLSLKRPSALWYAHKSVTRHLRIAERLVDFVFTSSADGFRLPSKKVFYLGQAIDTERFSPRVNTGGEKRHILNMVTVGRISGVKNYETMIHACEVLKRTWDRQWTLSIVGGPLLPRDHDYLSSLKKLVREKGLESSIHFYGSHSYNEIPDILREHDMFINLSGTGSLDKAVLEAMSAGLTVIVANEAYRAILPPQYFLEHISPEFLASRIQALANDARPNSVLRNIVLKNHDVEKTVDAIQAILSAKSNISGEQK